MEERDQSTSGFAKRLDFSVSHDFTDHTPMPSKSYCRLFKAQRYGKWHVLKGLQPEHSADPAYIAMLEKEFNTAVRMDHPNIVHVYGPYDDSVAGPCLVMEFIDGRTLDKFLEEKPSAALRRKVAMQLLDAMRYFHSLQIVHRDLKPANILITRNGDNVKLIDFGLADTDDYAILKEPAYTKAYAAPEQMTDGAPIDCRTDIYAFGLLLKQLFPNSYRHIVRRCTQHNPDKRYADAQAVAKAMQRTDNLRVITKAVALGLLVAAVVIPIVNNIEEKNTSVDTPEIRQDTTAVPLPEVVEATETPSAMAPVAVSTPEITTAQPAAMVKISDEELEAAKRKVRKICDAKKAEFANYVKKTDSMTYDIAWCKSLYVEQAIINSIYVDVIAKMPPMNSDQLTSNWVKIYRECEETFRWLRQYLENSGLPPYRKSVPLAQDPEYVKIQKDIESITAEAQENARKAFTGELWQK
ncbi:MAG: serine/threonine protein kinase [Bacteroidales bacterium]|nr:serine/threonine protein kinase [Bacteroidales bacterium]